MTAPIVYVDTSEVRAGRLAELRAAMAELTDFVEANEARLLAYHVCFSPEGTRMTVVHVNPDPAALEFHLDVAGPRFAPIGEFIDMQAIDVYGSVDDTVVDRLRAKASALGRGVVRVHDMYAGFSRLPTS
jgi:hypothetical protein